MRLMVNLGEWAERYGDYAVALLGALKCYDPALELTVHLFDTDNDRSTAVLNTRHRLARIVGDAHVYVSPYPLDTASGIASGTSLNAGLLQRLSQHISHFVFVTQRAQGVLHISPYPAGTGLVLTGDVPSLAYPPSLTLTPDAREGVPQQGQLRHWIDTLTSAADYKAEIPVARVKPRLAFVSPLPPLQTGIADYSVELLQALEPYYTITLIIAQDSVEPAALNQQFAIRDSQWFLRHGESFDRVLYHWGNSPHHIHMLALIDKHPGSVVLHDFFSGDIAKSLADEHGDFGRALYQAHGYDAVADWLDDLSHVGVEKTLRRYPLNYLVVSRATGVLVHSHYALELAGHWFPPHALSDWQKVPFLRRLPGAQDASAQDQASPAQPQARQALGIPDDAFVICTFGLITPNKCVQELFDAFHHSELAGMSHVRLIAVGGYGHESYKSQLEHWLKQYTQKATISVIGYADPQSYRHYLQAADIGVQLRTHSRGETSAAVFDCLAAGLPLVANAHGSVRELSPDVACLLPDAFTVEELSEALNTLHHSPQQRRALACAGQQYVQNHHSTGVVGKAYASAIEDLHQHSRLGRYRALLDGVQALSYREGLELDAGNVAALAESMEVITPSLEAPRLLVDVTNIASHDLRTGIERVTRNLCNVLLHSPPKGYRVELVRSLEGQLHYARAYAAERLGSAPNLGEDEPLTARAGDIYLSLEWTPPVLASTYQQFQALKARGVKLYFTVFDALPVQFPQHFPDFVEGTYQDWLSRVLRLADGLCCISAAVADDLRREVYRLPAPLRPKGPLPPFEHFHLGADFTARKDSQDKPEADSAVLAKLAGDAPILLMVGTLEPRKGHAHVLGAMEKLWREGNDARLVIVGKLGWKMDAMATRLQQHSEGGKRLLWVEGASDATLAELYHGSTALLAASEGEGFGLPLIEAAQWGIPIIARDLPVFREVAGRYASYFSATDAQGLARELEQWLKAHQAGETPDVAGVPWLSWQQSADQLLRLVLPPGT